MSWYCQHFIKKTLLNILYIPLNLQSGNLCLVDNIFSTYFRPNRKKKRLEKIWLCMVRRYIKCLKPNCASGCDGMSTSHLNFATDCKLIFHLTNMFNICLKYRVLPDFFGNGILIPILKKTMLNPMESSRFRPITVLLELHIYTPFMWKSWVLRITSWIY